MISIFSLWDELFRLILVSSLSIFTPMVFMKGDNTLSRCSRGKTYIQYLQYIQCHHIKDFSLFQSQLNTLKASSGPGLLSKCYSNCCLLFMRPKLQINCFETLSLWSPRAPGSNYMHFMTKCKEKKNYKVKPFARRVLIVSFFIAKRISKRYRLNYCDLSFSQLFN